MKFSICIPNYNYERYLGRTLASVLAERDEDLEVVVADNASTDASVAVVEACGDPRVRVRVNRCNVGFAGNLDRAAGMARGEVLIMLSSDDLMRPGALAVYRALLARGGAERSVVSATVDVIDPDDRVTGRIGPDPELWRPGDRTAELEAAAGGPVYRVPGPELLRRCLLAMKNPFNFAATAYPRALYEAVEGYGGGRLINPDKWFHWRLLGVAADPYFIDRPLFAYRWHPANQSAQQAATGALKQLVDEYASTLELDGALLARLGLSRAAVERAFVERDVVRHGLATLARGDRRKARRIVRFGGAVYPWHLRAQRGAWVLAALLALGPAGRWIAAAAYSARRRRAGKEAA